MIDPFEKFAELIERIRNNNKGEFLIILVLTAGLYGVIIRNSGMAVDLIFRVISLSFTVAALLLGLGSSLSVNEEKAREIGISATLFILSAFVLIYSPLKSIPEKFISNSANITLIVGLFLFTGAVMKLLDLSEDFSDLISGTKEEE